MVITLKHRSQNEQLVWILLLEPFLIAPLMQFAGIPGMVKYLFDLDWFFLLVTMIFRKKRTILETARFLLRWVIAFFVFTLINYIAHFQSALYYLWGFRNNFRGYVLFFAVIYYFDENNVEEVISFFDKIFYANSVLMLFQFFLLGYKQDNLGGIFGVESGCNGYVNLFFCIMLVINYVRYTNSKQSFKKTVINIVLMLVLAAMAELKFYYVEFGALVVLGTLITRFSWKKLAIVIAGGLAFIIGYKVFVLVFPDIDLSVTGLFEYASSTKGYTSSGDLNRLSFFSVVNNKLLPTWGERVFGLGLGNCDYATGVEALSTPFYHKFGWMHYGWMSTTFMYLENGLIGLVAFFGFFMAIMILAMRMKKHANTNLVFCEIAALCAVAAVMNGIYNISLRIESGYMIYFILAIPWCTLKFSGYCK